MFETPTGKIITHALALAVGAFLCVIAVQNDLSGNFWVIVSTCTIALFTIVTVLVQASSAALQKRYAEASWQRELHAERIEMLSKFEYLSTIVQAQSGKPVWEAIWQANNAAIRADFYFQAETANYLKEVAEKALLYASTHETFEVKSINSNISQIEVDSLHNELLKISDWLNTNANSSEVVKRLSPHLQLPNKL